MNKGGKLSDLQDFVCSMDEMKGDLEIHPMAEAVNFDGLVESCFKKMRPSSADCMFLSDGKTVYLEFKTWPYSPESGLTRRILLTSEATPVGDFKRNTGV